MYAYKTYRCICYIHNYCREEYKIVINKRLPSIKLE